jgi:hypothetical protein
VQAAKAFDLFSVALNLMMTIVPFNRYQHQSLERNDAIAYELTPQFHDFQSQQHGCDSAGDENLLAMVNSIQIHGKNRSKPKISLSPSFYPLLLSIMNANPCSRSYRLTTCRARCITAQGRIMSTTGIHNHPPHVKNASSSKMDLSSEHSAGASNMQTFAAPMSNQIQNMPTATVTTGMINQQQMNASMSFVESGGVANNNNFSMTNVLNPQMSEMDPNTILTQSTGGLNQLDTNIQISPIINASIDNMQMQQQQQQHQQLQQQQQIQRNAMNAPNMHVDIAITSPNN